MDSTQVADSFSQNGWSIYLISILVLIALFFIQKYAYLLDRKLSQLNENEPGWEGKPWVLWIAISLGLYTLLYNVFSPNDMQQNPVNWGLPEWALIVCFIALIVALSIESIAHFGRRWGLVRILVFGTLAVIFYLSGLLAGLLIVTLLALGILLYFINFWRKRIAIK